MGKPRSGPITCKICSQISCNIDSSNAEVYSAGRYFVSGYANIAIKLRCGHWLLDDRDRKCPAFITQEQYDIDWAPPEEMNGE